MKQNDEKCLKTASNWSLLKIEGGALRRYCQWDLVVLHETRISMTDVREFKLSLIFHYLFTGFVFNYPLKGWCCQLNGVRKELLFVSRKTIGFLCQIVRMSKNLSGKSLVNFINVFVICYLFKTGKSEFEFTFWIMCDLIEVSNF